MSLLSLKEVHSKKVGDILLLAKTRTETVQIVSVCNADIEKCSLKLLGSFTRT